MSISPSDRRSPYTACSRFPRASEAHSGVPAFDGLDHKCKEEEAMSLGDSGGELLYEAETVEKLPSVAQRLGNTGSERMRKLLETRSKSQRAIKPTRERRGASKSTTRRPNR